MALTRLLFLIVLILLPIGLVSCASLEKKFIRKKRVTARQERLLDVRPRLSNEQYYKQHFLHWEAWQKSLIKDLGGNHKKEVQDIVEAKRHLAALLSYLEAEKADKLKTEIDLFDSLTRDILNRGVPQSDSAFLRLRLERQHLRISKEFSYRRVQDFLKPNPPLVDISAYQDENP